MNALLAVLAALFLALAAADETVYLAQQLGCTAPLPACSRSNSPLDPQSTTCTGGGFDLTYSCDFLGRIISLHINGGGGGPTNLDLSLLNATTWFYMDIRDVVTSNFTFPQKMQAIDQNAFASFGVPPNPNARPRDQFAGIEVHYSVFSNVFWPPALTSIGVLEWRDNGGISVVSIPSLISASGIVVVGFETVVSVSFPNLQTVGVSGLGGDFIVLDDGGATITSVLAPALTVVYGNLALINVALVTVDFSSLQFVGTQSLAPLTLSSGLSLHSIVSGKVAFDTFGGSSPSFATSTPYWGSFIWIGVDPSNAVSQFLVPKLEAIAGSLIIAVVNAPSLSFPSLQQIGFLNDGLTLGDFVTNSFIVFETELQTLSTPLLTTLNAAVIVANNELLQSFDLSTVQTLSDEDHPMIVAVFNNEPLGTLLMPNLTAYYFTTAVISNNALVSFTIPETVQLVAGDAGAFLSPSSTVQVPGLAPKQFVKDYVGDITLSSFYGASGIMVKNNLILASVSISTQLKRVSNLGDLYITDNSQSSAPTLVIPGPSCAVDCRLVLLNNNLRGTVPPLPLFGYENSSCPSVKDAGDITLFAGTTIAVPAAGPNVFCYVQNDVPPVDVANNATDDNCFTLLSGCVPGCVCTAKSSVCINPGATGVTGSTGATGAPGAVGVTGAPGANGPVLGDLICSATFATVVGPAQLLRVAGGLCLFEGDALDKRHLIAPSGNGVRARVSASLAYRRHHEASRDHRHHHRAAFSPSAHCGPSLRVTVNDHVVFKNPDRVFGDEGTISGSFELDLPDGLYRVGINIVVADDCDDVSLFVSAPTVEFTMLQVETGLGPFKAPPYLDDN